MKTLGLKMLTLTCMMTGGIAVFGQQRDAEVPGDYFSLEGALELFKKSASPEEFERMLNAENSKVNNLDLNGDGDIDYIRVIDHNDGNVHAFIMQAVVSDTESQDVAVIELEKLANGKAVLQITGDEDVYGIETIIEPTEEVRINAGTSTARTVVNVWTWPSVQYVYGPSYTIWASPWSWHVRPVWWSSWRPVAYYDYYGWWTPYRPYYSRCHTHRVVYAQQIYRPYRTSSVIVHRRHTTQLAHYRSTYRNDDRNRRNSYDVRTRSRNDYSDRTPSARQRANSGEQVRSGATVNTPRKRENSSVERRSSSDNRTKTYQDRSEVRTRSTDAKRNSTVQPRDNAPVKRAGTVNSTRSSSQQRSVSRPERTRSGGSQDMKRSAPREKRSK